MQYMATIPKKHGISLEDVTFYLDAVERDRLDSTGAGGKAGEVLALRDKLLRLPDESFRSTVSSIRALIADLDESKGSRLGSGSNDARDSGRKLYEETRASRSGGARGTLGKVTS